MICLILYYKCAIVSKYTGKAPIQMTCGCRNNSNPEHICAANTKQIRFLTSSTQCVVYHGLWQMFTDRRSLQSAVIKYASPSLELHANFVRHCSCSDLQATVPEILDKYRVNCFRNYKMQTLMLADSSYYLNRKHYV